MVGGVIPDGHVPVAGIPGAAHDFPSPLLHRHGDILGTVVDQGRLGDVVKIGEGLKVGIFEAQG